jgi:hypothetical protein
MPRMSAETAQTVSGVASIVSLMSQLQTAGLQDKVTFMTLNVFGRTLATNGGPSITADNGRNHNGNHQVSLTIGKPFRGGVIGGVAPVGKDYGAVAIDPATGKATAGGSVSPLQTLPSFGQTVLAAVGVDPAVIATAVTGGKVIPAALL